jgi:multidrug resistance protein
MLISTFMAAVEITVISTVMPTIVAQLGGFDLFSWAFGIYLLAQAVATPLYGRLADGYGRKAVYLGSATLFLTGSLLCGCAWSMGSLIVFRAVQGIGGGGLVPMATIIIGDVSPPTDRPRMMGYVSGIWGISAIIGPLLGAFFVKSLGWPFVFWVNLPIGLLTMAMVARFLHEPPATRPRTPIDLPGATLLAVGIGAVMVTLVQGQELSRAMIGGFLAFGAVALVGFVWRERRVADPMLPSHVWRRPIILTANASALLCGALLIGMTAFLPTWVQGVEGGSALASGFVIGLMTVSWTAAVMSTSRVMARFSYRSVAVGGSGALLVGSLVLLLLRPGRGALWLDLASMLVGAGFGLNSLVFTVAVQSAVAWEDRGRATALYYFFRLIGQALGAAALGGVLNFGLAGALSGTNDAVRNLVSEAGRAALPVAELERLTNILAGALHGVFAAGAGLALGALLVALLVPRAAQLESNAGGAAEAVAGADRQSSG